MKKNIMNFIFCLLTIISLIIIFKNNKEVALIILDAINLFFKKVFVSLFPMFILNDLLISLNVPYFFYLIFNKPFKYLFKTSGICAYVFIMSLISGTPSNAYILKNLVNENIITFSEANHYLLFTYFSNPLFLTLMLSSIFNTNTTFKIIIIHYLSNIIIAFIFRRKAPNISNSKLENSNKFTSSILIKSINRSISTLLMILGTIVFYMILSYIISLFFYNFNLLKLLTSCFLEITNGLNLLNTITLSTKLKEIIAIATISFGGLSINTQIKAILEDSPLTYHNFLKGRIYQALISVIIILFI